MWCFQTPATSANKTGACLAYKHNMTIPGGVFEVDHNVFQNCFFCALCTGTYNGRFHHNLVLDSDHAFLVRNLGHDKINLDNNLIEFNTIVNTRAVKYDPSTAAEFPTGTFSDLTFRKNIVVDNHSPNPDDGGIVAIDPYGADNIYNTVMNNNYLQFDNNCYYNSSHGEQFCLFCSDFNGQSQGGMYSFNSWRSSGMDQNSIVANPQLDSSHAPANSACQGYGRYAP